MALTNEQYQALMRGYDMRRLMHTGARRERLLEVQEKCPRYKELLDRISENAAARARAAILGEDSSALEKEGSELRKERDRILQEAGFPADYLELRYDCPDCRDSGYIGTRKCHCFIQKTVELLYGSSNLNELVLLKENFDTLRMDYYDRTPMKSGRSQYELMEETIARCRKFVEEFDTSSESLLLYGPAGVGKTFLTNCIAKALLDSCHSVVYYSAEQLFSLLSENAFRSYGEAYDDTAARLIRECDLLIIDDLGTERVNSFSIAKLFNIINERLNLQKSTLISTNLTPDRLRDLYTERISSRLISSYELLELGGNDIRIMKKYGRSPLQPESTS